VRRPDHCDSGGHLDTRGKGPNGSRPGLLDGASVKSVPEPPVRRDTAGGIASVGSVEEFVLCRVEGGDTRVGGGNIW
jgi:hypothetical protein